MTTERSPCCGAHTSISTDDGVLYCKACFQAVSLTEVQEQATERGIREHRFQDLMRHVGHHVEVATYGDQPVNVSIECMDCHEVLYDLDIDSDVEALDSCPECADGTDARDGHYHDSHTY